MRRDIKKENDNNKLLDLKAEFDAHKRRADFAREVYYVTRQKAKNNQRKGDISMISMLPEEQAQHLFHTFVRRRKRSHKDMRCLVLNALLLKFME